MKTNIFTIIALILLTILFISCAEEDYQPPVQPQPPTQVDSILIPDKMALGSNYFHLFQVVVSGEFLGGAVNCAIYDSAESLVTEFPLYDDAGAFPIQNPPLFASPNSGDVIAGDGIFSRRINSLFTDYEGDFHFLFQIISVDSSIVAYSAGTLQVYQNSPPELNVPNPPLDTLISGFDPFSLNMLVTDEQGRGDIVEVKFELFAGGFSLGLNYYLTDPDLDSIFTFYFEPAFSAGIATGNYTFRFSAQDSLNAISYLPDDTVFIENTPPLLTDGLTDPDSVITIPDPGDTATVLVTVNVSDLQTLADIEEVFINYQRPDYLPDSLIWTFGYPMADNGLPWDLDNYLQGLPYLGDEVAGDGIFTFTKLYTSEADTGLHYFHFHCLDKTGHTADSISVELLLVKIPMGR